MSCVLLSAFHCSGYVHYVIITLTVSLRDVTKLEQHQCLAFQTGQSNVQSLHCWCCGGNIPNHDLNLQHRLLVFCC